MVCSNCGESNAPERKFCGECGAPLAQICAACGAPNAVGVKFCGECGSPAGSARPSARHDTAQTRGAPGSGASTVLAEIRLVSVLFADLVGFTKLSESRDPEEVRDLLSRYFEVCRGLIERYGGTVEKFIGDAVMAVWGAPVANEDDAERAVRAGLDARGRRRRAWPLLGSYGPSRARGGIVTGEVAVTVGEGGRGHGDRGHGQRGLEAPGRGRPGTVLVDEATWRAASGAIAFVAVPELTLKGQLQAQPRVAGAERVVGQRKGHRTPRASRAPLRRARRRARPREGPPAGDRSGAPGPAGLGDGRARDRQEQARVGVPQVRRRPRRDRVLAPRSLGVLRGGRHVPGARRDGPHARGDHRG